MSKFPTFLSIFLFSIGLHQVFANENPLSFAKNPVFKTREFNLSTPYGELQVRIHAAEKNLKKISRVEEIIRKDLSKVINYFQYVPKDPVHFNIDPYLLLSNGNASVFPQNVINLYTHPSVENEHLSIMDDWMKGLILHEYVHITHLSQTSGYLEFGRKIFGTFPKLIPSITPRWFSEGIATWAESTFLPSGRLHDPLLKREFLIKMANPHFCQKIDCMDEPGVHPNGQMSYWFGAHFLSMIENEKPGSIKCFVEENSGKLPFSLSTVFQNCTGNSLEAIFEKFKGKINVEFDDLTNHKSLKVPTPYFYLSNAFGVNDLQKGAVLVGDKLLKVEDERRREALVSYDLKEGISNSSVFSYPIVSLGDVVSVSTDTPDSAEEKEDWILVAFFKDPNYRKENRQFSFLNVDTLSIEKNIDLGHNPLILKALSPDHFISFSFDDDKFTIREKKQGEIEHLSVLPRNTTIVSADWATGKTGLWLKGNYDEESFIGFLDVKSFNLSILEKSSDRIETRLIDGKLLYKKGKETPILLSFDKKTEEFHGESINQSAEDFYFKESAYALTNENYGVHYLNEVGFKTETPEDREKFLGGYKKNKMMPSSMPVNPDESQEVIPETKDYFALKSLAPRWWFLSLASSSNLSTIGLQTGFSDSVNRHSGALTLESYTTDSKGNYYGGSFNYVFKQDQWITSLFGSRLVSENEVTKTLIIENEVGANTTLRWLLRRFTLLPGLDVAYQDEDSIFSNAKLKRGGLRFGVNYQAMSLSDLVQQIGFHARYGMRFPDQGDAYEDWGAQGVGRLQFWPELSIFGKFAYTRLEKSTFDRGILLGGGYSTSTTTRNFEFYGLNYGSAYGNEIVSFRLNLDYRALEFYRGYKLWPFFARDLRLLLGRDWISADRVIIGRQVLKDKAVNSLWGGANFRWTFAYYVPIETKLIIAKVFNPDGRDVRETLLTFDAEIW